MGTNEVSVALDSDISLNNDATGSVTGAGASFTTLDIGGTLTDGNDTAGVSGYVLTTVGTGVSWSNGTDTLPQTRTTASATATAGQTAFTFSIMSTTLTYSSTVLNCLVLNLLLLTDHQSLLVKILRW